MSRVSFHDQIARNKRKSVFLMILVILVIILLAYVIALIYQGGFFIILAIGSVVSILYVTMAYYNSHKIALAGVSAKPASEEKYRQYHHTVEGICYASGLPKPKLYVMNDPQINAFAAGKDPDNAVICVTSGCLEKLSKHEFEGIIAHEVSHIANYDVRFMTLTAVLVGMVVIISEIFLRSLWFGGGRGGRGKGGAILIIIGIILAILAPIFVLLVQASISRKREFTADASAVKFIRSPTGLIGALKKIKSLTIPPHESRKISKAVAPLFISNPFRNKGLTSTHPPLDVRIAALERM